MHAGYTCFPSWGLTTPIAIFWLTPWIWGIKRLQDNRVIVRQVQSNGKARVNMVTEKGILSGGIWEIYFEWLFLSQQFCYRYFCNLFYTTMLYFSKNKKYEFGCCWSFPTFIHILLNFWTATECYAVLAFWNKFIPHFLMFLILWKTLFWVPKFNVSEIDIQISKLT